MLYLSYFLCCVALVLLHVTLMKTNMWKIFLLYPFQPLPFSLTCLVVLRRIQFLKILFYWAYKKLLWLDVDIVSFVMSSNRNFALCAYMGPSSFYC